MDEIEACVLAAASVAWSSPHGTNDPISAIDDFVAPATEPTGEQPRRELYNEHCIKHKFI
jgi:hypothetical protein